MSDVEDVKSRLNIVDVVSDYVPLKRAGVNYKARCPFHNEKTPSFNVSSVRQIWHCFGCGLGGDVIEFVKLIEHIEFPEALKILAERAGVELNAPSPSHIKRVDRTRVLYELNDFAAKFYHKALLVSQAAQPARDYLKKRKLTKKTLEAWTLGFAPESWDALVTFLHKRKFLTEDIIAAGLAVRSDKGKGIYDRFRGRITFPIFDPRGRIVGFTARILIPRDDSGKYINSPESAIYHKSQILYGYFQARTEISRLREVVVVEGNMDVIKSHQAGLANVIGSSGTAITLEHLSFLSQRGSEKIIFALDADKAGQAATREVLGKALGLGLQVYVLSLPAGIKDPDEAIDTSVEIWQKAINESLPYLDFYLNAKFATLDTSDSHVTSAAVADYLAILALLPDKILAYTYCQKVAARSGISTQTIMSEYNKLLPKRPLKFPANAWNVTAPKQVSAGISSRERLEQRFIGLLLQSPDPKHYLSRHNEREFETGAYQKIYIAIQKLPHLHSDRLLVELTKSSPDLSTPARQAVYATEVELADADACQKELAAVSNRLLGLWFAEQQRTLATRIAEAERKGTNTRELVSELNQLLATKRQSLD